MQILNIAAYKFVALGQPAMLQASITEVLQGRAIKGTVLLAEEGINLFLAGPAADIHDFLAWLKQDVRFADLQTKESWSGAQPFRKLLVKVKPEIIRMNHPAVQPAAGRAPAVDAATLKRWLDAGHDDAGRPVVTLDTRNDFEADVGTFHKAIDWRIRKFTEFPEALLAHKDELAGKTVVSFCTGGIRCEKAAILMREAGIENVWQLDGGILKYFEESGHAHFEGECFVFDERRALDPALKPQVNPPAKDLPAPLPPAGARFSGSCPTAEPTARAKLLNRRSTAPCRPPSANRPFFNGSHHAPDISPARGQAAQALHSALAVRFSAVRQQTEALIQPLSPEDCQLQSMPDASPAKWHLAHLTWFFETFILERFEPGFTPFDASFRVLFNSYYNGVGDKYPRPKRGLISRPSLDEVLAYRAQVNQRMLAVIATVEAGADSAQRQELVDLVTWACTTSSSTRNCCSQTSSTRCPSTPRARLMRAAGRWPAYTRNRWTGCAMRPAWSSMVSTRRATANSPSTMKRRATKPMWRLSSWPAGR
jgi:UPF0176 protein